MPFNLKVVYTQGVPVVADWTPERLAAWEAFKLAEERKKAPKGT